MLFLLLLLSHRCGNGFDFHDEHLIGFYCGFQTKSYSTRRFLLSLCVCSTQSEQNSVLKMVRGIFGPMILLLSLSHSRIEIDLFCIFTTEIHFIFFIQEKKGMNDKMVHGLESNYTENSNISLFGESTAFSGGSSHFVFTV